MTPLGPTPGALAALESGEDVLVTQGDLVVFQPASAEPAGGLIFYPGGRVDARAYAPALREIAAQGYLVVLVPMPLNLAVFAPMRAAEVIDAYPRVSRWAVGGHSLGGSMAASFAYSNPDCVHALVLWASYPPEGNDLSASGLPVVSVYGDRDGVLSREAFQGTRALLPPGTRWVEIEGGNHAQFGSYGPQAGDGAPALSAAEQQARAVAATLDLLQAMGE